MLDAPAPHLSDHPVTRRWPAVDPTVLQLYSFPTPNGIKVSAMLEETGLAYEPHLVKLSGDVTTPEFLALNPNNKIPAILDPDGPDGQLIGLFESGAILVYLAEKTGKFLPVDAARRYETLQWLMLQMGGIGPMFGQLGYFHKFAGAEIADPRPKQRYADEAVRLLAVLDARLAGRDWIMGDEYTIADMATWPWVRTLGFYEAEELLGLDRFANIGDWLERALARPASQRALNIPDRDG